MPDENITPAAETPARRKPGRKPRVTTPASPDEPQKITRTSSSAHAKPVVERLISGTTLVELGVEMRKGGMGMGDFTPPEGFDLENYCAFWAMEEGGHNFPTCAELEMPKRMTDIGVMRPPMSKWLHPVTKQPHYIKLGTQKVWLYTFPRQNQNEINKRYAGLGRSKQHSMKELSDESAKRAFHAAGYKPTASQLESEEQQERELLEQAEAMDSTQLSTTQT